MAHKPAATDDLLLRMALGIALVSLRKRRGLLQQDVARQLKTTGAHLSNIERGGGNPKFSMIYQISEILKISPGALMRETMRNFRRLKNTWAIPKELKKADHGA